MYEQITAASKSCEQISKYQLVLNNITTHTDAIQKSIQVALSCFVTFNDVHCFVPKKVYHFSKNMYYFTKPLTINLVYKCFMKNFADFKAVYKICPQIIKNFDFSTDRALKVLTCVSALFYSFVKTFLDADSILDTGLKVFKGVLSILGFISQANYVNNIICSLSFSSYIRIVMPTVHLIVKYFGAKLIKEKDDKSKKIVEKIFDTKSKNEKEHETTAKGAFIRGCFDLNYWNTVKKEWKTGKKIDPLQIKKHLNVRRDGARKKFLVNTVEKSLKKVAKSYHNSKLFFAIESVANIVNLFWFMLPYKMKIHQQEREVLSKETRQVEPHAKTEKSTESHLKLTEETMKIYQQHSIRTAVNPNGSAGIATIPTKENMKKILSIRTTENNAIQDPKLFTWVKESFFKKFQHVRVEKNSRKNQYRASFITFPKNPTKRRGSGQIDTWPPIQINILIHS